MREPFRLGALILSLPLTLAACGGGYGRPDVAGSQLAFGVDMAKQNLWSEALFRFHQAERLDPDNPRVLSNLAVAYEATGEYQKALEHYQKALKISPDNREVRANYARFVEFYQGFKPDQKPADTPPAPPKEGVVPSVSGGMPPEPAPPPMPEPQMPEPQTPEPPRPPVGR